MIKVIVNGKPRTGKDTFVDFCMAHLSMRGIHSKKGSSVDGVKEAARMLGWDGVKDGKGRKFLSDLKDLSTAAYEGPMKYMDQVMKGTTADVVFFFIREPQEIAKFKEAYDSVYTVLVSLPRVEQEASSCHADENVRLYPYDAEVVNDRMLDSLFSYSGEFVEDLLKKYTTICQYTPKCPECDCIHP